MKDRLYSIMSDVEEITKQLADMQNVLEMQSAALYEESYAIKLRSALNVQIRLLEGTKEESNKLRTKIDDTILDVIHGRL